MSQYYPETMLRTYVINAPFIFTALWKIAKNFIHPVTAAKISVSSWGHEKILAKDGIQLSGTSIATSRQPYSDVLARLVAEHDMPTLAKGYMPPEDAEALAALSIDPS